MIIHSRFYRRARTGLGVAMLLSVSIGPVQAFEFVKVADQGTPVPGNLTGTFDSLGTPIIHQRQVVFTALSPDGEGIYRARLGRVQNVSVLTTKIKNCI